MISADETNFMDEWAAMQTPFMGPTNLVLGQYSQTKGESEGEVRIYV